MYVFFQRNGIHFTLRRRPEPYLAKINHRVRNHKKNRGRSDERSSSRFPLRNHSAERMWCCARHANHTPSVAGRKAHLPIVPDLDTMGQPLFHLVALHHWVTFGFHVETGAYVAMNEIAAVLAFACEQKATHRKLSNNKRPSVLTLILILTLIHYRNETDTNSAQTLTQALCNNQKQQRDRCRA